MQLRLVIAGRRTKLVPPAAAEINKIESGGSNAGQFSGVLRRLPAAPRRLSRKVGDSRASARPARVADVQPAAPRATVVFTGISPGGLDGPGKVERGFPATLRRAPRQGRSGDGARHQPGRAREAMAKGRDPRSRLPRGRLRIDTAEVLNAEGGRSGVFNAAQNGPIIADKVLTNDFLTSTACRCRASRPRASVQQRPPGQRRRRRRAGSPRGGRPRPLQHRASSTPASPTAGEPTTPRAAALRRRADPPRLRAGSRRDGRSASVHAPDTPLDPPLIDTLQKRLVDPPEARAPRPAARVAAAFGPGSTRTTCWSRATAGRPSSARPASSSTIGGYTGRLSPLAADCRRTRDVRDGRLGRRAAPRLFLDECARLGYLPRTRHGRSSARCDRLAADHGEDALRKFLIILDDTPEMLNAMRFAAIRASKTGGGVEMLAVISPEEFQHFIGVADVMRAEAREKIEAHFQIFKDRWRSARASPRRWRSARATSVEACSSTSRPTPRSACSCRRRHRQGRPRPARRSAHRAADRRPARADHDRPGVDDQGGHHRDRMRRRRRRSGIIPASLT